MPLFAMYHLGVWLIREVGKVPWANGADILIARVMHVLGIGGPVISLLVVFVTFLFVHQLKGYAWKFPRAGTLSLMVFESALFALPPFMLGKLVNTLLSVGAGEQIPFYANIVLACGAGVYEEFVFRFLLMGIFFLVFPRLFGLRDARLYVAAVLVQAVVFALFHHLPGSAEALSWEYVRTGVFLRAFAFRTLAGVYFAYLYQERGFGIAAGSHALYDVVAITLSAFR